MAADSLQSLLNFEYNFERAAVYFVGEAIPSAYQTIRTMTESNLSTPRVELALELGSATSPYDPRVEGSTKQDYSQYDGFFHARVVTDNSVGQTSTDHATTRAKLRELFLRSGANWNGSGSGANPVTLTGTGEIDKDSAPQRIVGTGTSFTTELEVGDEVTVGGVPFEIAGITSDTLATTTVAASASIAAGSAIVRTLSLASGPNLPFYDLKFIQPMESQYLTDEDFNVSELTWNLRFEIRDDAWPS